MSDGSGLVSSTAGASPSPAEVVAIMAAYEALWPKPVVAASDEVVAAPLWRFSGRWWRKPVAARRDRPW